MCGILTVTILGWTLCGNRSSPGPPELSTFGAKDETWGSSRHPIWGHLEPFGSPRGTPRGPSGGPSGGPPGGPLVESRPEQKPCWPEQRAERGRGQQRRKEGEVSGGKSLQDESRMNPASKFHSDNRKVKFSAISFDRNCFWRIVRVSPRRSL